MSHVISGTRIVDVYIESCRSLLRQAGYRIFNLILEIEDPMTVTGRDKDTILFFSNTLMQKGNKSIATVANTIFPQQLYVKHGYPTFYTEFNKVFSRAKESGTWGTYFQRLTSFPGGNNRKINQLEFTVMKLRRSMMNKSFSSIYELNISGIGIVDDDFGAELALYSPRNEGRKISNMPCMSHLSFKLDSSDNTLNVTAIYRSQYYCSKALGNLIGIARLQKFLCNEVHGLKPGKLTCIATDALLDVASFGGVKNTRVLLNNVESNIA